jgi:hypothetical protein
MQKAHFAYGNAGKMGKFLTMSRGEPRDPVSSNPGELLSALPIDSL